MIETTPVLDHYAGPFFAALFAIFFLLQWKFPLRKQHFSKFRRLFRNLFFSAPGFALARLSLVPIPLLVATWASRHHFGVLHLAPLPSWLAIALGVILMDYAYW